MAKGQKEDQGAWLMPRRRIVVRPAVSREHGSTLIRRLQQSGHIEVMLSFEERILQYAEDETLPNQLMFDVGDILRKGAVISYVEELARDRADMTSRIVGEFLHEALMGPADNLSAPNTVFYYGGHDVVWVSRDARRPRLHAAKLIDKTFSPGDQLIQYVIP